MQSWAVVWSWSRLCAGAITVGLVGCAGAITVGLVGCAGGSPATELLRVVTPSDRAVMGGKSVHVVRYSRVDAECRPAS